MGYIPERMPWEEERNVDYLTRVKFEKRALDSRAHKLSKFIDLPEEERLAKGVSPRHYELLLEQFRAMLAYQTALAKRISLLNSQKKEAKRYGK